MRLSRPARVAAVIALACPAVGMGADWETLPFGSIGGYYESNLGLSPIKGRELDVAGLAASAGVEFRATTPVSLLTLRPYLRSTYFPSETEADYNNAFFLADYTRTGQRSRIGFHGEFAHETITSEALPATTPNGDLGSPIDSDFDFSGTRSERDQFSLFPSIGFNITERNLLELAGSYSDVSYDKKIPGEELGYQFTRGSIGWGFNFSQLTTLTFAVATEKFEPEDAPGLAPSVGSSSYAFTARWSKALNEKQRWYMQGGVTETSFEDIAGVPSQGNRSGWTGGVGASWELQTSGLFVDATHRVQPSSSGLISNQTDLRFQLVKYFTPRWSGTLGARGVMSEAIDPNAATDDRKYASLSAAAEWRWTRKLSLQGEVTYVYQELENQPRAGNSQTITLSVAYDAGRRN